MELLRRHHLVMTGSLPTEALADFVADGSPRSFASTCLVNYLFLIPGGFPFPDEDKIFTDSVQRFSAEGDFKQVCHYSADS